VSVEALARPLNPTLAERLDAVVRAEFRLDVLVPAVGDPILGTPACAVPGCVHSSRYAALCLAHLGRWKRAGRPDRSAWAATADPTVMGHRALQSCLVAECGFGQHRYRLCYRHSQGWERAGRSPVDLWQPEVASAAAAVCAVPGCALWAELDGGWCRVAPCSVAAARASADRRVHRSLRQLRRGPLRLPGATAAAAAGDRLCAAMPGRCEPDPDHAPINQAAAGPSGRQWRRVAVGASARRLAGRTAGRGVG